MIARPAPSEYVPAGHRTHAVLAGTSEYVPAAHEQHALVAFSPSSVAFPVCVSRVFVFQFQGHRGQAPYFITGPTDVRLKRAAYLSRSCILEHTSHFLSRHIFQLRIPRMFRRWVPSSPSVFLIKKNQKSKKKKRNFLKINQKINGSRLALL